MYFLEEEMLSNIDILKNNQFMHVFQFAFCFHMKLWFRKKTYGGLLHIYAFLWIRIARFTFRDRRGRDRMAV
jgi:hypothetical protein